MFSAALRLPSSTSWAQRKERVTTVIQELGLERCANQKVHTRPWDFCRKVVVCSVFSLIWINHLTPFRLVQSSSVVCLEERGREPTLAWSSL